MAKSDLRHGLKFRRLLRRLPDVSAPLLIGHLELMWQTAWSSGIVAFADGDDAELAAEWDGEPGRLLAELKAGGWLDESELGLEIHDWWEHAPDYVRKRKDMLLIAIARGYPIIPQWLKDRGITLPLVTPTPPAVDQRSTIGQPTVPQWTPIPNPTQPNQDQTQPKEQNLPLDPPPGDPDATPYLEIQSILNAAASPVGLPTIEMTAKQRKPVLVAHRGVMQRDLERWRDFARRVAEDDWLTGRDPAGRGWKIPSWVWAISKADEILAREPRKRAPAGPGGNGKAARSPDGTPVTVSKEQFRDEIERDEGGREWWVRVVTAADGTETRRRRAQVEVDGG